VSIATKRIYEPATRQDGYRVLVDRLWPRGLSKKRAQIDLWLRDVAPSASLRTWFNHDPARWVGFRTRYYTELRNKLELIAPLKAQAKKGCVTLVYAARDTRFNQAVALQAYLKRRT